MFVYPHYEVEEQSRRRVNTIRLRQESVRRSFDLQYESGLTTEYPRSELI